MTAYIVGIGMVSPAGVGLPVSWEALRRGERSLGELSLFAVPAGAAPVGEVPGFVGEPGLPRTHSLALTAAHEALASGALGGPPEAVILGGTTGGIPTTEEAIQARREEVEAYRWHGAGTVAELVADRVGCDGPALTVATACSSGAVALDVALEMLRAGQVRRVLAGGVDALCRLTYHGFSALKVIDPAGARPLDRDRAGMTVGEGAALLALVEADAPPPGALAVLAGGALTCDAYHPSSPHPEGEGALAAMRAALADAGVARTEVGYVGLHGTGTRDNDASEAKAVRALFPNPVHLPPHSSIKGTFGHAVGAAGAMGAAVAALALRDGVVPGNLGCEEVDPDLDLAPLPAPTAAADLEVVLSNSFGFGGNNAALVITSAERQAAALEAPAPVEWFSLVDAACVTGAGRTDDSLAALGRGAPLAGVLELKAMSAGLPARRVRRLKRLPRMALALAAELGREGEPPPGVTSLFMGTRWGALTETHDFLNRLFDSGETVSSPTDFVGTVHNAVTGQLAMWLDAHGANVTATTGDASFDDALRLASLLVPGSGGGGRTLVMGVDEAHPVLTPRLDPPVSGSLADGGGALLLEPAAPGDQRPRVRSLFRLRRARAESIDELLEVAGDLGRIGAVWWGAPGGQPQQELARSQLERLLSGFASAPNTFDYRAALGHWAGAPAAATALAALAMRRRLTAVVPANRGVLVLTLGDHISALELAP